MLVHPDFGSTREGSLEFNSVQDWEAKPSTKIQALLTVLEWHLKQDKHAPMSTVDGKVVAGSEEPLSNPDGLPDKIVVYSFFVGNSAAVSKVGLTLCL